MCEDNFRVFRRHELCYIVINMACFFFIGLGVCMLDVHYTKRWYNMNLNFCLHLLRDAFQSGYSTEILSLFIFNIITNNIW
jgi:hypothetical protein